MFPPRIRTCAVTSAAAGTTRTPRRRVVRRMLPRSPAGRARTRREVNKRFGSVEGEANGHVFRLIYTPPSSASIFMKTKTHSLCVETHDYESSPISHRRIPPPALWCTYGRLHNTNAPAVACSTHPPWSKRAWKKSWPKVEKNMPRCRPSSALLVSLSRFVYNLTSYDATCS
jgi:hypothetical protein